MHGSGPVGAATTGSRSRSYARSASSLLPASSCAGVVDDCNPFERVWSFNGTRRDITNAQRLLCYRKCEEGARRINEERTKIAKRANEKRSEATKAQPRTEDRSRVVSAGNRTPSAVTSHSDAGRHAVAQAAGVDRGTVERMDRLATARPDLAEKVRTGDVPASAAIREMKRN